MRREMVSQRSVSRISCNLAVFSKTPSPHPHFYPMFLNPKTLFKDVSKYLDTNPLNQGAVI